MMKRPPIFEENEDQDKEKSFSESSEEEFTDFNRQRTFTVIDNELDLEGDDEIVRKQKIEKRMSEYISSKTLEIQK